MNSQAKSIGPTVVTDFTVFTDGLQRNDLFLQLAKAIKENGHNLTNADMDRVLADIPGNGQYTGVEKSGKAGTSGRGGSGGRGHKRRMGAAAAQNAQQQTQPQTPVAAKAPKPAVPKAAPNLAPGGGKPM